MHFVAWKDDLLRREAMAGHSGPAPMVGMDRHLAERDGKDLATREALGWRSIAQRRARQRDWLVRALVVAVIWVLWLLVKGA